MPPTDSIEKPPTVERTAGAIAVFSNSYARLPGGFPTRSATPSTALVPQRKVGFPIPNAGLLVGFQGTKTVRREGISSPLSEAGGCTSPRELRDDARGVRSVVDAAIDNVTPGASGPIDIEVASDSFDLKVTLRYNGNLPPLPDARPKRDMLEEQSFVNGLTGYLAGLHADRIDRSAKGEACEIALLFRT